jgi:hypothetical protein
LDTKAKKHTARNKRRTWAAAAIVGIAISDQKRQTLKDTLSQGSSSLQSLHICSFTDYTDSGKHTPSSSSSPLLTGKPTVRRRMAKDSAILQEKEMSFLSPI